MKPPNDHPDEPHAFLLCTNKHLADITWKEPHCGICLREEDHAIHRVEPEVPAEAGA